MKYRDARLDNYTWKHAGLIESYIEHYDKVKQKAQGIYFYGQIGTWKTRALATIANELLLQWYKSILFYNATSLVSHIRSFIGSNEPDPNNTLVKVKGRWLLLLDDIDKVKSSEWIEEFFYDIVNTRYEKWYPTCYSANIDIANYMKKYTAPIGSRMHELSHLYHMDGEDRRLFL
jgi:DNA replication protein DnaC